MAQQAFRVVEGFGQEAQACQGAAFEAVVESNLLTSALASGLGGATALAAHSFCNGLSAIPELHPWLHGELVGLGLLFQQACMKELGLEAPEGLEKTEGLLGSWNLPTRLPKAALTPELLKAACQKMLHPDETIHLLPGSERLNPKTLERLVLALSA
jgi:glycerol dehydrogenase